MEIDEKLDVRGQTCPVPLVETRKKLNKMSSGQVLEVIGDHGPSKKEVPDTMKELGNEILDISEEGEIWHVFIRKK